MNNKGTKEPVAQKRGFYIVLYSILAALLVLAAVISYNNYTAVKRAREMRAQMDDTVESYAVNASQVQSYLTQPTPATRNTTPRATPRIASTPAPRTAPATPAPRTAPAPAAQQPTTAPNPAPAQTVPAGDNRQQSDQSSQTSLPSASPAPANQPEAEPNDSSPATNHPPRGNKTSELETPIVEVFTEGNTMRWPVLGEIVMDFSNEQMVYDRTLEQYRTNDVLCIATDIGTPVLAAAGGVVTSVTNSRELGNTIVLDHGNGWTTCYSQLQDGVLVKEGDVVNAGQAIGGVGAPSLYYVLLGNHLGFSVSNDETYVDPKLLLE